MAYQPGRYPHTGWLELHGDGTLTECIIMREDPTTNDVYFIALGSLDRVDLERIGRVLNKSHSVSFPLPDLLAQTTLGNGMNALLYFQQLVRVFTRDGKIVDVVAGRRSAPTPVRPKKRVEATAE